MNGVKPEAAAMSMGLWAVKFVREPETWPVFVAWMRLVHPKGAVVAEADTAMLDMLAALLADLTLEANR